MIKQEYLEKLKKFINLRDKKLYLTEILLCSIALGEELSPDLYNKKKVEQAFNGLRRYKFVRHTKQHGKNTYSLTPKGKTKIGSIIIDNIEIKTQKHWDGKWHLVMYDLPIRFKKARNAFRWKLKDIGFFKFQKSAWIYPYPCEGEILFVADFFGVRRHIEILEVDKILDDKKLKTYFGL